MNTSTTRLGQILLDKGVITAEQLNIALDEQRQRRMHASEVDQPLSLGEILIELGFIDRLQLKRGLNWQSMLRKVAIAMSFCAPLMTFSTGAIAATRPSFTFVESSSSSLAKVAPGFTKTSSSVSSSAASISSSKSSSSSSKVSVSIASSSSSSRAADFNGLKMSEITVALADYDRVQLQWSAVAGTNILGYKIFRDQVEIDAVSANQLSFSDFNVAASRTYLYGISVGDADGNWSPVKSILVQTKAAPKGVEVKSSSSIASSSAPSSSSSSSQAPAPVQSTSSSISSTSSAVAVSSSSKATSSVASSVASVAVSSSSVVSSAKSSVSSSASSVPASSVSSSAASSSVSSSSNTNTTTLTGPANFSWLAPSLRENGNILDITELGGYELRYRKTTDSVFTYININDAWKNYYNFTWLDGTYIFQVAAFDTNGLYSNFVDIKPQ